MGTGDRMMHVLTYITSLRACADAAFHLYDFTTAQEKYEAAKQIAPDNVAVWEGLARLLEAAGDRCETVKAYHKLVWFCSMVACVGIGGVVLCMCVLRMFVLRVLLLLHDKKIIGRLVDIW